jgi:hypothetical protein
MDSFYDSVYLVTLLRGLGVDVAGTLLRLNRKHVQSASKSASYRKENL